MTAKRSARVSTSTWSWVTQRKETPGQLLVRSGRTGLGVDAGRAAYADAVSEYAALGRDELREAARAVMPVTSGRG